MAESKLKIDVRRNAILDHLRTQGTLSVARLSEALQVTPVTIRNDLAALEQDGYLTRTRGGAVLVQRNPGNYTGAEDPESFSRKQALAAEAVSLIQDGQTLFFNSGTTTHHVARALREKKHLNIVTNSLAVAMELGGFPTFHVLLLGGEIDTHYGFTCGGDAQDQLSKYQADWAILSVDGVSANGGITTYHPEEAIIDRLMIRNARQCMVVATGNKIGNAGFTRICDSDASLRLVTEQRCDWEALEQLQAQGVSITTVSV